MKQQSDNILFITVDELHCATIEETNKAFQLKGIPELKKQATCYRNVYSSSPVCLPARCSWVSGKYPHRTGCASNQFGASLSKKDAHLFTCLKEAGYHTSLHGKCHFIPVPYPATRRDMTLEYEHFIEYYKSLGIDHLDLQDDKNNSMWYYDHYAKELEAEDKLTLYRETYHGTKKNVTLPDFPLKAEEHPDSWVGRKALERITESNRDEKNFIWVSFSGPHYPMDAPKKYENQINMDLDEARIFREDEWDDVTKLHRNSYFGPGGTEGSGGAPGGAQKEYDEAYWRKWRTNLTIIFSSDHGDMMGNHSLWGKNHSLYEDVVRVPLMIQYPGQTEKKDYDEIISSLDVMPTILNVAGVTSDLDIDGKSIPVLLEQGGRDYVISECHGRLTIIKDQLKLCVNEYEKTKTLYLELYDLEQDPYEFTNIYGDENYQERVQELIDILNREEEKSGILSTIFGYSAMKPFWYHGKNGSGLEKNGMMERENFEPLYYEALEAYYTI